MLCLHQKVSHLSSLATWNFANQGEEAKQADSGPVCLSRAFFAPVEKIWNPVQASHQRKITEFKGAVFSATKPSHQNGEEVKGILQVLTEILHRWHFFLEHCFFFPKSFSLTRQFCAVAISYGFADPW